MRRKKLIEIPWDELKKYFGKVIILTRDQKIEEFEEGVFSTKTTIYESCVAILDNILIDENKITLCLSETISYFFNKRINVAGYRRYYHYTIDNLKEYHFYKANKTASKQFHDCAMAEAAADKVYENIVRNLLY